MTFVRDMVMPCDRCGWEVVGHLQPVEWLRLPLVDVMGGGVRELQRWPPEQTGFDGGRAQRRSPKGSPRIEAMEPRVSDCRSDVGGQKPGWKSAGESVGEQAERARAEDRRGV